MRNIEDTEGFEDPVPAFECKAIVLRSILPTSPNGVEEFKLLVHPDRGLSWRGVDPAHVMMRSVELPPQEDVLECFGEFELGIEAPTLRSALSGAKPTKMIKVSELPVAEKHSRPNWLRVSWGPYEDSFKQEDTLGMSDPKLPRITLPVEARIGAEELKNIFRRFGGQVHRGQGRKPAFGNHIRFVVTHDRFKASYKGDNRRLMANFDARSNGITITRYDEGGPFVSVFSLDYLRTMLDNTLKGTEMTFEMGTDYPLRMTVDDFGKTDIRMLAPRIENE